MKSTLLLLLLIFYHPVIGSGSCKEYGECRLNLLSRRFSCLEEPRKAVEQSCKLKEDLKILWKSSLWKEKGLITCLLSEQSPPSSNMCFKTPNVELNSLEKCGMALKLLEEQCDLLRNCCKIAEKCLSAVSKEQHNREIKFRIQSSMEKTISCNRKIFSAIQNNMTAEDIVIARSLIRRTSTIRSLLEAMADTPMTPPYAPLPPISPPKSYGETFLHPLRLVDSDDLAKRKERREPILRAYSSGYKNQVVGRQISPRIFHTPRQINRLRTRMVKTLYTQLLQDKRKGFMKPWRDARIRSISSFPPRRSIAHLVNYSVPHPSDKIWQGRIEEVPSTKNLRDVQKKTTETTLKPVYLAMKFIDRKTWKNQKKWTWETSGKSSSEEDFEREFEKNAGSLVTLGANALPLPGTHKLPRTDDPLHDIVEKHDLHVADLFDLTTRAPVMRPKLKLTTVVGSIGSKFPRFTTPRPFLSTTRSLWNPLLSFFSTPSPLYISTAFPIQIWPFKKAAARASKIFNETDSEEEELLPNPVESAAFTQTATNFTEPIGPSTSVEFINTEKGYCTKYQTCIRVLDESERECESKLMAKKKRKNRRESICGNLDNKFQITELVKSIELDYRRCIWNDSEGYNLKRDTCEELSTLPIDFYTFKNCHKKVTELRRHCEKQSKCCSAVGSCRALVASSSNMEDLKRRQERLETMKNRCQQKKTLFTNPFKGRYVPKVEGEARLDPR